MKFIILVAVFNLIFLAPVSVVEAQESGAGGFVTCSGTDCSACNLVEMANTGIVWLFGAALFLFTFLMVVAGFGLVTSGGNPSALEDAKSKFKNLFIGLAIIMSAWLIVNTIMVTLVKGNGVIEGYGPWTEVKCQTQTVPKTPPPPPPGGTGDSGVGVVVASSTATSTCPVPALSPITDPLAQRMEAGRGNAVIWEGTDPKLQSCVNKFIAEVGGRVTSAYRPQSYQTHLWEIRDRWCTRGLKNSTSPSCSVLKSEIGSEVSTHFGSRWNCGAVAQTNSTHGSGRGVDISGPAHGTARVQAAAARACLEWKNYPGDAVHYDLSSNSSCSCN